MPLLNFGSLRSHCSEKMVRSQQNENYLGTLELFTYPELFCKERGRKQGDAGGEGLLFIHQGWGRTPGCVYMKQQKLHAPCLGWAVPMSSVLLGITAKTILRHNRPDTYSLFADMDLHVLR